MLPEGVTSIGEYAFHLCTSLKTIVIPSTVTDIDEGAFFESRAVDDIFLLVNDPNELTWSADYESFKDGRKTKCHVPSGTADDYRTKFDEGDYNVTFVDNLFGKCGDSAYWMLTDTNKDGTPDKLTISGTGAMYDYVESDNKAPWYDNRKDIKTIEIADGITHIGENAFYGCSSLTSFAIPASVTTIGKDAFFDCTACTDVYCPIADPNNLRWVDGNFNDFIITPLKTTKCHVPSGSMKAYRKKFNVAVNVTFVADLCGDSAIWEFDSETGKLAISGTGAMWDFNTDTNIIPWYEYINDIKSVEIADGITKIGAHSLRECSALTSVTIPDSVTEIGDFAFYSSELIEDVALSGKLTSIGEGAFAYCSSLKNISIPKSVTTIGNMAFSFCSTLEDLSFADGSELETIGECAFSGCVLLESVTIPACVKSIGIDAFVGCISCTDVYCLVADPTTLTWTDGSFDDFIYDEDDPDTHKVTKCHVAKGKLDAFNTKFGNTVNVTFVDDLVDMGIGAHLYGHSLSLDGDIGVNFYMELGSAVAASETAYMLFTVSKNDGSTETQNVYVKEVLDKTATVGDKTYYQFKCRVAAKDMTAKITAQMHYGDTAGEQYTYSVKEYAAKILESPETYFPDEEQREKGVALVKAMLNYGSYAQVYFDPDIFDVDDERTASYDIVEGTQATIESFSGYITTFEPVMNLPEGITFEGATLSLKSQTTLSLYFTNPNNVQFDVEAWQGNPNGTYMETETSGKYTIIRLRGISVKDVDRIMILSINITEPNDYTAHYTPLYYCKKVVESDTTSDELKNVCKALYLYWRAAHEYFGY